MKYGTCPSAGVMRRMKRQFAPDSAEISLGLQISNIRRIRTCVRLPDFVRGPGGVCMRAVHLGKTEHRLDVTTEVSQNADD